MSNTTLSGTIKLYHYSKVDLGDQTTLDPKETLTRRSSYSQKEYRTSSFPRVFYYTDLTKVEHQVQSSAKALYTTTVDGKQILKLNDALSLYKEDKESLEKRDSRAYDVIHALIGSGFGVDWDNMFKVASNNYIGVFYDTGNLPIVTIFVPLKVTKHVS